MAGILGYSSSNGDFEPAAIRKMLQFTSGDNSTFLIPGLELLLRSSSGILSAAGLSSGTSQAPVMVIYILCSEDESTPHLNQGVTPVVIEHDNSDSDIQNKVCQARKEMAAMLRNSDQGVSVIVSNSGSASWDASVAGLVILFTSILLRVMSPPTVRLKLDSGSVTRTVRHLIL